MTRRTGGLYAKKSGDAFEETLSTCVLDPLKRMGEIGRYDKLNPEYRRVRRLGEGLTWCPVKDSGGDWILSSRGIYVAAEAKSTALDRFARNLIPTHQQDHLTAALTDGGLAFLFLRFTWQAVPVCYMLPWARVPWRILKSAQSVSADECKPWAVFGVADAKRILIEERNGR
jgi:hypothetical protein